MYTKTWRMRGRDHATKLGGAFQAKGTAEHAETFGLDNTQCVWESVWLHLLPKGKNVTNWDWGGGQGPGHVEALEADVGHANFVWNAMRGWMVLNQFMLLENHSPCCLKMDWVKMGQKEKQLWYYNVMVMVIYPRWNKIRSLLLNILNMWWS